MSIPRCQNEVENHSTEPMRKSVSRTVLGPDGSMHEIKTDSTGREWIDIGEVKKWVRWCPSCGKAVLHGRKDHAVAQERKGSTCVECQARKAKVYDVPDKLERPCPKCGELIIYKGKTRTVQRRSFLRATRENRICNKCSNLEKIEKIKYYWKGKTSPNKGNRWTPEQRIRYSVTHSGENAPRYGMKTPESTKEKLRNLALDRRKKVGHFGINPVACDYLDGLSKERGWNLRHGKNGGEYRVRGYLLDGYDADRNIAVEYDEPHHYDVFGNLRKEDVDRMNTIIQTLHCKFFRYNEKANLLYECN